MASVRLIGAVSPYSGEEWLLKRTSKGLVLLDENDDRVTRIPIGEVSLRIHFPSFLQSRTHIVIGGDGEEFYFEAREKSIQRLRDLIDDCADEDPAGAAAAYRSKATRDLLIGGGSFLLGMLITCGTFLFAQADGKFVVTGGLIIIGLIEIIRGIYYAIKANQLSQMAAGDEDEDEEDEDEEEE